MKIKVHEEEFMCLCRLVLTVRWLQHLLLKFSPCPSQLTAKEGICTVPGVWANSHDDQRESFLVVKLTNGVRSR